MSLLVAISATTRPTSGIDRVRLNQAYVSALEEAGLVPLVIPPVDDPARLLAVLPAVQGLVLSGGEDVDPALYGAAAHAATHPPQRARDASEMALLRGAHDARLPTLAICRGVQLANVAFGGTLIQDIPSEVAESLVHDDNDARGDRIHDVRVDASARLATIFGTTRLSVNSIHHQSVREAAPALRVTACADDGVVEGVEWNGDDWWMLGVQWHPEELTRTTEAWDRDLFRAFARACGERAARP